MTTDPDLAALHRDALEAIRDALDIPYAAIDAVSHSRRYALAEKRQEAAYTAARIIVMFADSPAVIAKAVEALRVRIDQTPVTYETLTGPAASATPVSVR